jgi:hypothetical protein
MAAHGSAGPSVFPIDAVRARTRTVRLNQMRVAGQP